MSINSGATAARTLPCRQHIRSAPGAVLRFAEVLRSMTDVEPDDEGVVFTAGVSSVVLDGDDVEGHVLLLDCDDVDELTAIQAASSMDGVSAVFESSPGSFHIWHLSVRSFEQAILDGLSWRIADAQHVAQSRRRGYYVLRATAKVRQREDGPVTHYKDAPRLVAVYADDLDDAPAQSLPHLRRLHAIEDEQDVDCGTPAVEDVETVGGENGLSVDRYMTLDDDAKARVRGD
jgi:hypothetical protein